MHGGLINNTNVSQNNGKGVRTKLNCINMKKTQL